MLELPQGSRFNLDLISRISASSANLILQCLQNPPRFGSELAHIWGILGNSRNIAQIQSILWSYGEGDDPPVYPGKGKLNADGGGELPSELFRGLQCPPETSG